MLMSRIVNEVFSLDSQKRNRLRLEEFKLWLDQYFDIMKFFEIFELIPGPLKEREIIRQIIKKQGEDKTMSQTKNLKYYVLSYKWWELWRFYINYNYCQKPD